MPKKSSMKKFAIGVLGGNMRPHSLSSYYSVTLGSKFFTNPFYSSLISAIIDTLFLAKGIVGFAISKKDDQRGSRAALKRR